MVAPNQLLIPAMWGAFFASRYVLNTEQPRQLILANVYVWMLSVLQYLSQGNKLMQALQSYYWGWLVVLLPAIFAIFETATVSEEDVMIYGLGEAVGGVVFVMVLRMLKAMGFF